MDEKQIRKRNLWYFPLGTVGRDMVYVLITNYLLIFAMFTRELTNPQLAAISAIMVAARIFDGLNDPIMGNIIERTRTRWGKFKPWLLAGALSTTLVIIFLFNNSLQGWPFIWAFGVCYFLFSITYTMNDISYWGMIPALGSDANARNQFTSRATLFAGIGSTLASMLIPMLTAGAMTLGGNTRTAYGIIAIIIGILAPVFLLFTLLGVRENRDDMATKPQPLSFKKIISTITGNDQLLWIALCFLIQQIGNNIILGGLGSTYIYFSYGYRGGLYSLFSTVGVSVTALLMIFYPVITRHMTRKKLMKVLLLVAVIGYVLMIASMALSGMAGFWVLTIGYMLGSFGQYGFYLIMMISILNTVEYNEYKRGTRDEAIIASLRPFLTKLGSAISVLATSLTFMIFRVNSITNQISALENAANAGNIIEEQKLAQIDAVLAGVEKGQTTGLLLVMVILSCVMLCISFFIYQKRYKIDETEYDRICAELAARK
ncbi:MAG: MFS transporter [Firmicutes bacterium]|nr:MFS transporter [Bacillota bacterium]